MSDEVKVRIFEPFFTTKKVGAGTGLGLATCFGFVKQSGGHILVESAPDQGSTFRIFIPRLQETANSPIVVEQLRQLPRGSETILLIEAESDLRELATRVLRHHGYTVLAAANGGDALELVRQQPDRPIHLLLTDLMLPHRGNETLTNQLISLFPAINILFISSYNESALIRRQMLEFQAAFLQKPFTPEQLIYQVRELLDQGGPARRAQNRIHTTIG